MSMGSAVSSEMKMPYLNLRIIWSLEPESEETTSGFAKLTLISIESWVHSFNFNVYFISDGSISPFRIKETSTMSRTLISSTESYLPVPWESEF
jgi:hypothetical protein